MQLSFLFFSHAFNIQFDWVCDDSWKPQTAQSIFFVGAIVGTLVFGWISDHYGRVWTLMISLLNVLVTGIATPFVDGFVTFAFFRFMMGLSFPTFFMNIYMLSEFGHFFLFSFQHYSRQIWI